MAPVTEARKTEYFERAVHQQQHESSDGAGNATHLSPISEEGAGDGDSTTPAECRPADYKNTEKADARRSSIHQIVFSEVRRLSKAAPRASWNLLRLSTTTAIGYLTPKMSTLSPEALRALSWRQRADFYLSQPEDSSLGRTIQIAVMIIIVLNMTIMAGETLDGPRYGSTDPGYVYLPGASVFWYAEAGFTAIYIMEFVTRSVVTKAKTHYWKSWTTWLDVLALIPFLIHVGLDVVNTSNPNYDAVRTEDNVTLLRLVRLIRLALLSRIFLGTKILVRVSKHVLAPLKITVCLFGFFKTTSADLGVFPAFFPDHCRHGIRNCHILRRALLRSFDLHIHRHFQRRLFRHAHVRTLIRVGE